MQTAKDAEIVRWLGHIGAAGAEDVMGRFGMGRSWAYARLSRLVREGLVEHRMLLYRRAGLYSASAEGLRWCGLERFGVYRVGPAGFEHAQAVAERAVALHGGFPGCEVLSERAIRALEADRGELLASAVVGRLPGDRPALHRPDLAVCTRAGRVLAVEVELSVKAPRRLAAICLGYARARHVSHVYYLAADAPARAVRRGVAEVRAEDRITVLALSDVQVLIQSELVGGER